MNNTEELDDHQINYLESLIRSTAAGVSLSLLSRNTSIGQNQTAGNVNAGTANNAWLNNLFNIVNMVIGALGAVANFFTCIVFLCHKPLRQRIPNYFLANQCIIDLFISMILFLNVTVTASPSGYVPRLLFCYLWSSRVVFSGLFNASIFNLAVLTVERYLEVVHPIVHKLSLSRSKVIGALAFSWMLGIGYKLIVVLSTTTFGGGPGGPCLFGVFASEAAGEVNVVVGCLVELIAPVVTIAICYTLMVRSMQRTVHPMTSSSSSGAGGGGGAGAGGAVVAAKIRKNILKTLLIVVIFMSCSLVPKQCFSFAAGFAAIVDYNSVPFRSSLLFMYLNCCVNPFIYLAKYAEFRKGVRKMVDRVFKAVCGVAFIAEDHHRGATKTVDGLST